MGIDLHRLISLHVYIAEDGGMIDVIERQSESMGEIFGVLEQDVKLKPVVTTACLTFRLCDHRGEVGMECLHKLPADAGEVVIADHLCLKEGGHDLQLLPFTGVGQRLQVDGAGVRSEERRVGKECRSRWSA